MKYNIVIAAGTQVFEFEGEILEFEDTHILLKAKRGDIFIERKYLVFIQALEEINESPQQDSIPEIMPVVARSPKIDQAVRFINKNMKRDPLDKMLNENLIPPSQMPDDYAIDSDDLEVQRNVMSAYGIRENPITKATSLKQAAHIAMNSDDDFSIAPVSYKSPMQSILGMSNASTKKTRAT